MKRKRNEEGVVDSTNVWGPDAADTKHAVAAAFDDKVVFAFLAGFGREDEFNAAISAISTSNALKGHAIRGEDHGLTVRVELDWKTDMSLSWMNQHGSVHWTRSYRCHSAGSLTVILNHTFVCRDA
jgi:hypothetical protein